MNTGMTGTLTDNLRKSYRSCHKAGMRGANLDFLAQQCGPHDEERRANDVCDASKLVRGIRDADDGEQDAYPTGPEDTISKTIITTLERAPENAGEARCGHPVGDVVYVWRPLC